MWRVILMFCVVAFLAAAPGHAQQAEPLRSQILVIDTDQLFLQSRFGLRVARDLEEQSASLQKENTRIEEELAREEKALTEQRPAMDAEAFRVLANRFDEKVQRIRKEQLDKSKELNSRLDQQRVVFLNAVGPVLEELMRSAGASVLLEQRAVIASAQMINITPEAIQRIDAVLGEGTEDLLSTGEE